MQFIAPPNLYYGENSSKALAKFKGERIAVVSGKSWRYFENYVEKHLGKDYSFIEAKRSSQTGEPTEKDVERLTAELKHVRPNYVIAVGGGSVIDMVKAAAIFAENDDLNWENFYNAKWKNPPIKIVAVETTSGTGTGVSAASVVIHENLKKGVVHKTLVPYMSIYDPYYTKFMPREVAKSSGMDALTHAVEAYTSNVENIVSDTLALKAVEIIVKNIVEAVEGNYDARVNMHLANMLAGLGFTNSRLTICHGIAHKLGARLGIPHGIINAIFLPPVVEENLRGAREKFEKIAEIFGISVDKLGDAIRELNDKLGIPNEIHADIDMESIAEEILQDRLMIFNPAKLNREDVKRILRKVFV